MVPDSPNPALDPKLVPDPLPPEAAPPVGAGSATPSAPVEEDPADRDDEQADWFPDSGADPEPPPGDGGPSSSAEAAFAGAGAAGYLHRGGFAGFAPTAAAAPSNNAAELLTALRQTLADSASMLSVLQQRTGELAVVLEDNVAGLGRRVRRLDRTAQLLSDTIDPPPVPAPSKDPVSGLPWRSGFGNCARQLLALERWRGRRAGAFAGWTAHGTVARTWDGLRGGPLGKYDKMEGVFTPDGAYNIHAAPALMDKRAVLIWVFPWLPGNDDNSRAKGTGPWRNPGVWARYNGPDSAFYEDQFVDVGARLGLKLHQWDWPPENFVVDLGHESTGSWYAWSIGPDHANARDCWRRAVDAMRVGLARTFPGAESKVRFQFRYAGLMATDGRWGMTDVWPGRDWSATLGISAHGGNQSWGVEKNWQTEVSGGGQHNAAGLARGFQLALAEGIQVGLTEWGVVREGKLPGHPTDSAPGPAMARFLEFVRANAGMIAWECFLHSSAYWLLDSDKAWPGGKVYLEQIRAAAEGVPPPKAG